MVSSSIMPWPLGKMKTEIEKLKVQPSLSIPQEITMFCAASGRKVSTQTYRGNFVTYLKTSLSVRLASQNFSRSGELDNAPGRLVSKGKRKLNRDEPCTMVDIDWEDNVDMHGAKAIGRERGVCGCEE